jgi:hypothetical protein
MERAARAVLYEISYKMYTPVGIYPFIYAKFHTKPVSAPLLKVLLFEISHKTRSRAACSLCRKYDFASATGA